MLKLGKTLIYLFSSFRSLRGKSFKKWLSDIKMVLFNPMAVLLLLFYATASGYSAMIATKLEQLMCSQVRISYLLCHMTSPVITRGINQCKQY